MNTIRRRFFSSILTLASLTLMSAAAPPAKSVYDFQAKRINGEKTGVPTKLSAYKGKVLLIVNVASECGYTPQYKGLEALYEKYGKDGLEILGFPANNFGSQEPGTNEEIKHFCENNYKVKFPIFEKADVKGKEIQPLYDYLTENAAEKGEISWNFEKFLVARDGKIVGRFKSNVKPEDKELTGAIETNLKTK